MGNFSEVIGLDPFFDSDADNTVQTLKAGPGELHGIIAYNVNNTTAFLQLFDESGAVTVGTTVPTLSMPVPAEPSTNTGHALVVMFPDPVRFRHSMKYACTTTATGSTDPTTGLVVNFIFV